MTYSIAQNIKLSQWDTSGNVSDDAQPWLFSLGRSRPSMPTRGKKGSARGEEIRAVFASPKAPIGAPPLVCAKTLPSALSALALAVEKSRWMLDLLPNWDEEGALAYESSTWERATNFLCLSAVTLWGDTGVVVPAPEIQNGPEGTIDLFWESEETTLLINIPIDAAEPAMFYGSSKRGDETRGTVQTDHANTSLLLWARG